MNALQIGFGSSTYNDFMEALINLRLHWLKITHFEIISDGVRGLSNSYHLSCFL